MPASAPPLWDGYDDADEDQLVALLEGKAAAAHDDSDDASTTPWPATSRPRSPATSG